MHGSEAEVPRIIPGIDRNKTVSWTGELVKIGGSKTIRSKIDGQSMDRDINGARGIFLRALGDTPWLRNQLALAS